MVKKIDNDESEFTDFGYKKIVKSIKTAKVSEVFHSVANKYNLMNDLMSMGIHRFWKYITSENIGIKEGDSILDIAGGTGDLTARLAKKVGETGQVILADINESMLSVGRDCLLNKGLGSKVQYVLADAQYLPFQENTFDFVTIAFGIRNFTDKLAALNAIYKVLKPKGQLCILEFSKTNNKFLTSLYDMYSFKILPKLGQLVANDEESYRYLVESIRMHPDQEAFKTMMEQAGFSQVNYYNMTGGIVALHIGSKAS